MLLNLCHSWIANQFCEKLSEPEFWPQNDTADVLSDRRPIYISQFHWYANHLARYSAKLKFNSKESGFNSLCHVFFFSVNRLFEIDVWFISEVDMPKSNSRICIIWSYCAKTSILIAQSLPQLPFLHHQISNILYPPPALFLSDSPDWNGRYCVW